MNIKQNYILTFIILLHIILTKYFKNNYFLFEGYFKFLQFIFSCEYSWKRFSLDPEAFPTFILCIDEGFESSFIQSQLTLPIHVWLPSRTIDI